MKTSPSLCLALALLALTPLARAAEPVPGDIETNRLSFSVRMGYNISARFTAGALTLPSSPRTTPNGDLYNYDDGYLLTDISGNLGDQTWYWGYDDSSAQISGNTILLSRTAPAANFSSPALDGDPNLGAELVYSRHLGNIGDTGWRWGFEVAANYLNLDLSDRGAYAVPGVRTTDAYPFTPGTTPPAATPASPYQGTFGGPGYVIGATPVNSTTIAQAEGITASGLRKLCANIWGFRVGPYLEFPANTNLNISLSGGLAAGYIDASASWSETITLPDGGVITASGTRTDSEMLWGFYVGAHAQWRLNERWSALTGVQYQDLGTYRRAVGARNVELDLRNSILLTLGLSWNF
jgi:hypothetical protein